MVRLCHGYLYLVAILALILMHHNMEHFGLRDRPFSVYKYRIIVLIASRTQPFCMYHLSIFHATKLCRLYVVDIFGLLFVKFSNMHKSFSCLAYTVYIQCIDMCGLELEWFYDLSFKRNKFPIGCRAELNRKKYIHIPASQPASLYLIWILAKAVYQTKKFVICFIQSLSIHMYGYEISTFRFYKPTCIHISDLNGKFHFARAFVRVYLFLLLTTIV